MFMYYDSESNIMSLELMNKATISHAVKFGNFIIHLSKTNTPILIEVLDASKITKQFDKIKNIAAFKGARENKLSISCSDFPLT